MRIRGLTLPIVTSILLSSSGHASVRCAEVMGTVERSIEELARLLRQQYTIAYGPLQVATRADIEERGNQLSLLIGRDELKRRVRLYSLREERKEKRREIVKERLMRATEVTERWTFDFSKIPNAGDFDWRLAIGSVKFSPNGDWVGAVVSGVPVLHYLPSGRTEVLKDSRIGEDAMILFSPRSDRVVVTNHLSYYSVYKIGADASLRLLHQGGINGTPMDVNSQFVWSEDGNDLYMGMNGSFNRINMHNGRSNWSGNLTSGQSYSWLYRGMFAGALAKHEGGTRLHSIDLRTGEAVRSPIIEGLDSGKVISTSEQRTIVHDEKSGFIHILERATGKLSSHDLKTSNVVVSPDGRYVAMTRSRNWPGTRTKTIEIYEAAPWKKLNSFSLGIDENELWVKMRFGPNSDHLYTIFQSDESILKIASWKSDFKLDTKSVGKIIAIDGLRIDENGSTVTVASTYGAALLHLATEERLSLNELEHAPITGYSLSPKNGFALIRTKDRNLGLWDLEKKRSHPLAPLGTEISLSNNHVDQNFRFSVKHMAAVDWDASQNRLAIADEKGIVHVYDLPESQNDSSEKK